MSSTSRCAAAFLSVAFMCGAARAQPPLVPPVVVLHAFAGADGASPDTPLLPVGNDFYGTTRAGGHFGWGTIFRISRDGAFTLLYSFTGLGDGGQPQRLVRGPDGAVYGTTAAIPRIGGQPTIPGTFFRITSSGALQTLYVFRRGEDGYFPGELTAGKDGEFYGIAREGGILPKPGLPASGTAFRLNTQGQLTVLHVFSAADNIYVFNGQNNLGPFVEGPDGNLYASSPFQILKMTLTGAVSSVGHLGFDVLERLMLGRDGRIYGGAINGFYCAWGNIFSFSVAGDFMIGPTPQEDHCGYYSLFFQTADLTIIGMYSAHYNIVGLTPKGVIPDPMRYPALPSSARLIDGGDGQIYGVTRAAGAGDFGSVVKVSILGIPKPPANVHITQSGVD